MLRPRLGCEGEYKLELRVKHQWRRNKENTNITFIAQFVDRHETDMANTIFST